MPWITFGLAGLWHVVNLKTMLGVVIHTMRRGRVGTVLGRSVMDMNKAYVGFWFFLVVSKRADSTD